MVPGGSFWLAALQLLGWPSLVLCGAVITCCTSALQWEWAQEMWERCLFRVFFFFFLDDNDSFFYFRVFFLVFFSFQSDTDWSVSRWITDLQLHCRRRCLKLLFSGRTRGAIRFVGTPSCIIWGWPIMATPDRKIVLNHLGLQKVLPLWLDSFPKHRTFRLLTALKWFKRYWRSGKRKPQAAPKQLWHFVGLCHRCQVLGLHWRAWHTWHVWPADRKASD